MTSLFSDAITSTASTMDAAGLTPAEIATKMSHALNGFEKFLSTFDIEAETRLAKGAIYIVYSGTGQYTLAEEFKTRVTNSGLIGDTSWGSAVETLNSEVAQDAINALNEEFGAGVLKYRGSPVSVGTLKDIMFNYGSPSYIKNASENGSAIRGFIGSDASSTRGFGALELPVAIEENVKINGVVPANLEDAKLQSAAFGPAEEATLIAKRPSGGTIAASEFVEAEQDSRFKTIVKDTKKFIGDLATKGIDVAGQSLAQIERTFVTVFQSSTSKMADFAEYAETRAKYMISLIKAAGGEVPAAVQEGIKQAASYFEKPDLGINKSKIGLTMAGSVFALADVWVEADKRGGFLALQLRFSLEMGFLRGGLMGASPEAPGDHVGWFDASLREAGGDAADLLHRPADQRRRARGFGADLFGGGESAALA